MLVHNMDADSFIPIWKPNCNLSHQKTVNIFILEI